MVDALVEIPYGAFPHECYGLYEADFTHFDAYVAEIRTKGTRAIQEYLDRYIHGAPNHQDYLALFGEERLARQAGYARELVGRL
jgi:glutaconate CoA-transferase subunit A